MIRIVFEVCGTELLFHGISGIWVIGIEGLVTHIQNRKIDLNQDYFLK